MHGPPSHLLAVLLGVALAALLCPGAAAAGAAWAAQPSAANVSCSTQQPAACALMLVDGRAPHTLFLFATAGLPTALTLIMPQQIDLSRVAFNWTALQAQRYDQLLTLPEQPLQVTATALASIIEFDDCNKSAAVSPQNFVRRQLLDGDNWHLPNVSEIVKQNSFQLRYVKGNFSVLLSVSANMATSHSNTNPHLALTMNSTSIDYLISNFSYTLMPPSKLVSNNSHRLALEVFLYKSADQASSTEQVKSIDDEYSPSIFRRQNVMIHRAAGAAGALGQSYFSYKPVVFGSPSREATNMSDVSMSNLLAMTPEDGSLASQSIALSVMGADVAVSGLNISFGTNGDGWYNPRVVAFSTVSGPGKPSTDSLSTALLLTLSISLGLPGVVIVLGGMWATYKRLKRKHSDYEAIN